MSSPRADPATIGGRAARRRGPRRPHASPERIQAHVVTARKKASWHLQAECGIDLERHADVRYPYLAGKSRPIAGQQTWFRKPKGHCGLRLHCWSVGDPTVCVEPGWDVDRYHRNPRRVDGLDPGREGALGSPGKAGAEDGVDDGLGAVEPQVARDFDPDPAERFHLALGRVAKAHRVQAEDARQLAPAMEVTRRRQSVPGVVAYPADHGGAIRGETRPL